MKPRTLIALALAAALLGGYVLLVERGQHSSDELRMQKRRVAPTLQRDRVTSMTILRQGRSMTLRRKGDETWTLGAWRADPALADRILSGVEFLEFIRTLPEDSDRTRLGLDRPSATLTLSQGGGPGIQLILGRLDTSGQGVYLAHGSRLFVVSASFRAMLEKDPAQLRDRELVTLSQDQIRAVRIHQAGQIHTLEPGGKAWRVGPGTLRIRAHPRRAGRLLVALRSLRAARFLVQPGEGTPRPWLEIKGKAGAPSVRLGEPGPCPGRPTERRLLVTEQPPSGAAVTSACCVAAADLTPLATPPAKLLDLSPTDHSAATLARVTITRGGRTLTLTRDGGKWLMGKAEADVDRVRKWVSDLAALQGTLRTPAAGEALAAGRVELLSEEKERQVILFGEATGGRVPALRRSDRAALSLPTGALELLRIDPASFKAVPAPPSVP